GRSQAKFLLHQLDEDGAISFRQDDPRQQRFQGQAEMGYALLAFPQTVDEPADAVLLFLVGQRQLILLPQPAEHVEAVLQPQLVSQVRWDDLPVRRRSWWQR